MTKEDIRADVQGMVENAIEEIFFKMQSDLKVTDGGIDPWSSFRLSQKEDEIVGMITDILYYQPKEEY